MDNLQQLRRAQRAYFESGSTRSYAFRCEQLRRLRAAVQEGEAELTAALKADLGKPDLEGYVSEIGFVYAEIRHTLRHLRRWMRPEPAPTPLPLHPSRSYVVKEPLGQVLIIGPWNYPINLMLAPLVGAIAAGNVAVIKPSELALHTSRAVARLIAATFPPEYVAVLEGGVDVAEALLAEPWDHIFFTGSTTVGRIVARAAAEHLTPVTLELGGKSPCIVDREIDIAVSARRIAWGKFFNAGQTCVAPDYLLVHADVKEQLLSALTAQISTFFGPDPRQSKDYARIINERHFDRLVGLLGAGRLLAGGQHDRAERYISPTVLVDVPLTAPVMQEEIFGPILPVLTYRSLDEAIAVVRRFPKPLSLYLFSTNKETHQRVLADLSFGGGCINNTLVHLSNPHLPFGGVGPSGMGAYHGRHSFDTFSHRKAIVHTSLAVDLPVRYQPYRKENLKLVRRLMN